MFESVYFQLHLLLLLLFYFLRYRMRDHEALPDPTYKAIDMDDLVREIGVIGITLIHANDILMIFI